MDGHYTEFMKLAAHIRLAHEKLEHVYRATSIKVKCVFVSRRTNAKPGSKGVHRGCVYPSVGALWATDFIPQVGIEKLSDLSVQLVLYGGIPIQDAERLTESYAFSCWRNWKKNLNRNGRR